ncbi:MAG: SGNH/GDSL hydrolase family protein [Firmicutes bacterium]|nr:SGNH/GDSL hydrolase family protein [Bacillota bacterium]
MKKITIVGFGDSLTYGFGVRYGVGHIHRLEKALPEQYPDAEWKMINSGVNGDTTREGVMRLKNNVLRHMPDIVLILFGSNDSAIDDYQFRSVGEFTRNMEYIVENILENNFGRAERAAAPVPVLFTPPPVFDVSFMPYTTNARIDIYADVVREVAEKYNCPLLDANAYMKEKSGGNMDPFVAYDGVHLNEKGYDMLFELTFDGICKIIEQKGLI